MIVERLAISEVMLLRPRRFEDGRGYFSETYNARVACEHGLASDFVQDNQSYSALAGTVRGLHFQSPPMAQTKLVRVARGAILDVAVDIRRGSPTYGHHVCAEISAENGLQIYVPRGFLHGFATLVADTDVLYKVDNYYDAGREGAVRFDDPDLGIDWKIAPDQAHVSAKDMAAPFFRDLDSPFVYENRT